MTDRKAYNQAYYQAHKESVKAANKAWHEAHRDEHLAKMKAYNQANKEQYKAYKKAYSKSDVNSLGQTKGSIRSKSQCYINKYGTKIPGYEIHHCCTYTELYKFIYCSIAMHKLIHAYLRAHNIDADSDHFEQIKHLLDESVVLYGIER